MGDVERTPAPPGSLSCPWCGSTDVEQLRDFGSLMMTSQWFCLGCRSQFERIRLRGSDGEDGSKDGHLRRDASGAGGDGEDGASDDHLRRDVSGAGGGATGAGGPHAVPDGDTGAPGRGAGT